MRSKRIFSGILALASAFTYTTSNLSVQLPDMSVTTYAEDVAENKCGDFVYWKLSEDSGTLTIYGKGEMYANYLDIGWTSEAKNAETVIIEDGVTSTCN